MSPHLHALTGYEFYGYVEEADMAVGKDDNNTFSHLKSELTTDISYKRNTTNQKPTQMCVRPDIGTFDVNLNKSK